MQVLPGDKPDRNYAGVPVHNTIPTTPPATNPVNNLINFFAVLNGQETVTTLMIRNIPMRFTQSDILSMIECNHANKFDYFYLPMDLKVRSVFLIFIRRFTTAGTRI